MPFTSYDEIIAAFAAGNFQERNFFKTSVGISQTSGYAYSLWAQGSHPAAGSFGAGAAGTFTAHDDTTTGALAFVNPTAPDELVLTMFGAQASAASGGTLLLYDRVGSIESLPIGGATGTTAVSTTIGRYATEGTQLIAEVVNSASVLTTPPVFSISKYTNQDGTTLRNTGQITGYTISGTAIGRIYPAFSFFLPLQAGDTGVRSVEEYTLHTASASASARLNIVFAKPLCYLPLSPTANVWVERDMVLQTVRLPRVYDDACLAFAVMNGGTNNPVFFGNIVGAMG